MLVPGDVARPCGAVKDAGPVVASVRPPGHVASPCVAPPGRGGVRSRRCPVAAPFSNSSSVSLPRPTNRPADPDANRQARTSWRMNAT